MKILFVAFSNSIHTSRWINQIIDQGWDIHLFPSVESGEIHHYLKNTTVHIPLYKKHDHHKSIKIKGFPVFSNIGMSAGKIFLKKFFPDYRVKELIKLIDRLKPDVIHSLEIQSGAYLVLEAKKRYKGRFPPWIVTNWGSDIYLFGKLSYHQQKIREVMKESDFYSCECCRDVVLAKGFGFKGKILPVFPNTGGIDINRISSLRQEGPCSNRRFIMLKGYQNWAGRALVGIRALERCADFLKGYRLVIYCSLDHQNSGVAISAELFEKSTGIPVEIIPLNTPHEEILRLHGKARISIGLSISDGISTSFLEALAMGSFPIQSYTSCANEWIKDGETGLLVPPEDPDVIEKAIIKALTDDGMVDKASIINYETIDKKLNKKILKKKVIEYYRYVFNESYKKRGK